MSTQLMNAAGLLILSAVLVAGALWGILKKGARPSRGLILLGLIGLVIGLALIGAGIGQSWAVLSAT